MNHQIFTLIDIAQAADWTPKTVEDTFFSMINWIAGIVILTAAIYLPFQIGGIGQGIINGFGKIYKTGMDAGKSAVKTGVSAGKWGLTNTAAGVQIQTAIAKSPVGQFFAAFGAEKKIAETEKKKVDRHNELGSILNLDPKLTKESTRKAVGSTLIDRTTQDTLIKKGSADAAIGMIDGILDVNGDKIQKGQALAPDKHEDLLNAVSALETLRYTAYDPEQKKRAEDKVKELNEQGYTWDRYGNVTFENTPSSKNAQRILSEQLGLSDKQIQDLAISDPTKIKDHFKDSTGAPIPASDINKANDYIKDNFSKWNADNPSRKIENIEQLAATLNTNTKNEIESRTNNMISVYQNTPLNVINDIKNHLNSNQHDKALEIANNYNLTSISDKIRTIALDNTGAPINPNSLNNFILNRSITQYHDSREQLNNYINSHTSTKFDDLAAGTAPGFSPNPYQNIIINNTKHVAEELRDHDSHESIKNDIHTVETLYPSSSTSPTKITEEKIKAIIESKTADPEYIKSFFENDELSSRINDLRSRHLLKENGQLQEKHINEILRRIQKIDSNYENINRKLTIYNQ